MDIIIHKYQRKTKEEGDKNMSKDMNDKEEVPFPTLIKELEQEIHYHANGGTSYRKETAQFALQIAEKIGEFAPLLKRETVHEWVTRELAHLDRYRHEDITKMLYVIARDLQLKHTMSDEMNEYLHQKRLNRKPLTFKND
jgi:hypothetical protein